MDRRGFLLATTAAGLTGPQIDLRAKPAVPSPELSLADIASAYTHGRFTSRELTQEYLDRIAALDRHGPGLGAVDEIRPRLRLAAKGRPQRDTGLVERDGPGGAPAGTARSGPGAPIR